MLTVNHAGVVVVITTSCLEFSDGVLLSLQRIAGNPLSRQQIAAAIDSSTFQPIQRCTQPLTLNRVGCTSRCQAEPLSAANGQARRLGPKLTRFGLECARRGPQAGENVTRLRDVLSAAYVAHDDFTSWIGRLMFRAHRPRRSRRIDSRRRRGSEWQIRGLSRLSYCCSVRRPTRR